MASDNMTFFLCLLKLIPMGKRKAGLKQHVSHLSEKSKEFLANAKSLSRDIKFSFLPGSISAILVAKGGAGKEGRETEGIPFCQG